MKLSLQDVRRSDLFVEIEPPSVVYHMTPKANVEKILSDGKIRPAEDDYLCFFFPELKYIPIYLDISNALTKGRLSHGFDGKVYREPPLNPEDYCVLKLVPRVKDGLAWYMEDNSSSRPEGVMQEKYALFDECRICHYDAMRFKRNPEIMELTDVLEKYSYECPPEWK